MVVPYNLLPIEMHLAMITAEQGNIPVLTDAARMWTECRAWIDQAAAELNTRVGELTPEWQDDAGRAHEEKVQRSLAELKMWGERIDAAKPAETLTTLASAIPGKVQEVTALHEAYQAALLNPFTAGMAPLIQQASGAVMTEMGAHYDMSMLKVVAASGIQNPGELMPAQQQSSTEGNSPADFIKAAEAGMNALTEVEGLAESLGMGGGGGQGDGTSAPVDLSSLPGTGGHDPSGLSLAGLAPATSPMPVSGAALGAAASGAGAPPVPSGMPGIFGAAGGMAGIPTMAKPVAGKKAPSLASEIRPGAATPAAAKSTGTSMPPMMPAHGGQSGTAGTLRPGSGEQPTGRSGGSRRPAAGTDGVPSKLLGRSAKGNPDAEFTLSRGRRAGETDADSVQLLDEELWRPERR
ncbi:hypothetical protein [Amycolatopsis samaneae]|uniref:PPE family protein n=1 Tax=Amycolatopsis samaneae TaxID=664691 RepID=A0ABW5GUP7_9PSEU